MALTEYQTRLQNLLQYPSSAATQLYATSDLTRWINQARMQLAGEAQCIRAMGTISAVPGTRPSNFSSINTGVAATTGIAGVMNVRTMNYTVGTGFQFVYPRAWEWFQFYNLNNPAPEPGAPVEWSQFKQGAAGTSTVSGASGSFYLDPIPDFAYTLNLDCVCYPIELVADGTVEAIPFEWTDCVPFLAAYYALLSSQTSARTQDAERMFNYYSTYVERARNAANPQVNGYLYQGSPDPTMLAKLGVAPTARGGNVQQ